MKILLCLLLTTGAFAQNMLVPTIEWDRTITADGPLSTGFTKRKVVGMGIDMISQETDPASYEADAFNMTPFAAYAFGNLAADIRMEINETESTLGTSTTETSGLNTDLNIAYNLPYNLMLGARIDHNNNDDSSDLGVYSVAIGQRIQNKYFWGLQLSNSVTNGVGLSQNMFYLMAGIHNKPSSDIHYNTEISLGFASEEKSDDGTAVTGDKNEFKIASTLQWGQWQFRPLFMMSSDEDSLSTGEDTENSFGLDVEFMINPMFIVGAGLKTGSSEEDNGIVVQKESNMAYAITGRYMIQDIQLSLTYENMTSEVDGSNSETTNSTILLGFAYNL